MSSNCLQDEGFSEAIIDRFFRPFLGGIFFDRGLSTSSRLFEFVMRCLATGSNCLPAQGIGAIADQLASKLPEGSIRTGQPRMLPASERVLPSRGLPVFHHGFVFDMSVCALVPAPYIGVVKGSWHRCRTQKGLEVRDERLQSWCLQASHASGK